MFDDQYFFKSWPYTRLMIYHLKELVEYFHTIYRTCTMYTPLLIKLLINNKIIKIRFLCIKCLKMAMAKKSKKNRLEIT